MLFRDFLSEERTPERRQQEQWREKGGDVATASSEARSKCVGESFARVASEKCAALKPCDSLRFPGAAIALP